MVQGPIKRQIKLEMPADPSATYANSVMISHTASEVIFDFIQIMPNDPRARVQRRIVMTPLHAKLLLNALQENVNRYEAKHGEVKIPQKPESLAEQLFRSVASNDDNNDPADSSESDDE